MVLSRLDWRWVAAKAAVHAAALWPLALMVRDAVDDRLGADPVAELTHRSGLWALRLLLACLAMTPLRRMVGDAWPIRFRRMLGLYACLYASAHLAVYAVLDLGGDWGQIGRDLAKRPFITVGFLAWLLLLPLALTSTRGWMRRLGSRWQALHRTVYAIGGLAVLHFLWLVKKDLREPLAYGAVLAVLLGVRAVWRWRKSAPVRRPASANRPAMP